MVGDNGDMYILNVDVIRGLPNVFQMLFGTPRQTIKKIYKRRLRQIETINTLKNKVVYDEQYNTVKGKKYSF